MVTTDNVLATYLGSSAPTLTGYYPEWLDNMADDATLEGSLLDGAVRGEPIGCVVLVTRNAAGQTQRVVASYRPRSTLLLLSRLLHEKFADTSFGEQFAA